MKKNNLKKVISIILFLIIMVIALSITVSARYQNITVITVGLSIEPSGLANCSGYVLPSDSSINTKLTVSLQKYSGSSWVEQYSWSDSSTGIKSITISGQRYVTSGKYRVVVTANIYNSLGTLIESQNNISNEVTY